MTIKAAGILFLTPDNRALFLKRSNTGDHPGEWCFPGGTTEGDETAAETAIRETAEEVGRPVDADDLVLHTRNISNAEVAAGAASPELPAIEGLNPASPNLAPAEAGVIPGVQVDFTTFVVRVAEVFTPVLNEEHTGYAWASVDAPPEPLHPGCRIALNRLTMDELGVARAIAAGDLTSPQRYRNVTLWAIRITGTGAAYRKGKNEFVLRNPEIYLNDEFLARCNGLAVIMVHPKGATLNSQEFADRVIGAVMLPYIKGTEVWSIAKVYDDAANAMMAERQLSTSPTVVLKDGDGQKLKLDDGAALLIEGEIELLDHIAVVPLGVWDKAGEPAGVDRSGVQADSQPTALDPAKLARAHAGLTLLNIRLSNLASRRA